MKVEKHFLPALESIVRRSDEAARQRRSGSPWVGTREHGVMPNTVEALERRGAVDVALEKGGRRLLCRPTAAGRALVVVGEVKP